jgi:ERF superfamily protein
MNTNPNPDPDPFAMQLVIPQSPQSLIALAIERQTPVESLEKLLAMAERLKADAAREAFFNALAAFQGECPTIKKNTQVYDKHGRKRYRYAPLEDIVAQVGPLLRKHGFAHTEDSEVEVGWVIGTCTAHHIGGHKETSTFKVPIQSDAYMNEAQKYASALTFAKRYAFCARFGILTGDEDDDAQASSLAQEEGSTTGSGSSAHTPRAPQPAAARGPVNRAELESWLEQCKTKLIKLLAVNEQAALQYAIDEGIILPNEGLAAGTVQAWFPSVDMHKSKENNEAAVVADKEYHLACVEAMMSGEQMPTRKVIANYDKPDAAWRRFPMPWGKDAGTDLALLPKKTLFGWWANYVVETEYNGKPISADKIARGKEFRGMLDEAGKHYKFTRPQDETPETYSDSDPS